MSQIHLLSSELTIYTAAEHRTRMLDWLGDGAEGPLVVDASSIQDVDAAGVQLLVSLSRSLAQHQRRLELTSPSESLRQACTRLGLAELLGAKTTEGATA
jgi:anti-anti-sigma factor